MQKRYAYTVQRLSVVQSWLLFPGEADMWQKTMGMNGPRPTEPTETQEKCTSEACAILVQCLLDKRYSFQAATFEKVACVDEAIVANPGDKGSAPGDVNILVRVVSIAGSAGPTTGPSTSQNVRYGNNTLVR